MWLQSLTAFARDIFKRQKVDCFLNQHSIGMTLRYRKAIFQQLHWNTSRIAPILENQSKDFVSGEPSSHAGRCCEAPHQTRKQLFSIKMRSSSKGAFVKVTKLHNAPRLLNIHFSFKGHPISESVAITQFRERKPLFTATIT